MTVMKILIKALVKGVFYFDFRVICVNWILTNNKPGTGINALVPSSPCSPKDAVQGGWKARSCCYITMNCALFAICPMSRYYRLIISQVRHRHKVLQLSAVYYALILCTITVIYAAPYTEMTANGYRRGNWKDKNWPINSVVILTHAQKQIKPEKLDMSPNSVVLVCLTGEAEGA